MTLKFQKQIFYFLFLLFFFCILMSLYNIIVIGDCGVGKTASIIRFTQNYFLVDFDPSFEDSYDKYKIITNYKS